jgi:hypothetical protein
MPEKDGAGDARGERVPVRLQKLERFLFMDFLDAQLRVDAGRVLHAT